MHSYMDRQYGFPQQLTLDTQYVQYVTHTLPTCLTHWQTYGHRSVRIPPEGGPDLSGPQTCGLSGS